MTIEKITYAAHTVHLHHMIGAGVLVQPNPNDDMPALTESRHELPGGLVGSTSDSLHQSDRNAVDRDLTARRYEVEEDGGSGEPFVLGYMPDGRECLSLIGGEPIISDPSDEEIEEARDELRREIGFEPISAP